MEELRKEFDKEIYRPGEDVSRLARLSDQEKSQRRMEIEAIFADPEKFQAEQARRYEEADAN